MKKLILMWSVVLTMFVGGPLTAQAGEGRHDGSVEWRAREGQVEKLFNDLNLSAEQKKQLEENRDKHREQMAALRKSTRELRRQIQTELEKPQLDMGRINELQGKLKEDQARMLDYRLEGILSVHKILTPAQFREFSQQMNKRKESFRKKMSEKFGESKDVLQDSAEVTSEKSQ